MRCFCGSGALVVALVLSVTGALAEAEPSVTAATMEVLPLGAIRPVGWLREQLENQASGLTGHAEELYEDIGRSDWLTGAGIGKEFSWERGPYYAKGLVSLAFVLDDAGLKDKAKRWVDAMLSSQRENGDFGPKDRNWWANMIALWMLRDWCEATGDERVVPFCERYFAFQRETFRDYPLAAESKWAVARAGDELDVVLWLWRKTGKDEWRDFAKSVAAQSADWTTYYYRGGDPAGPNANGCRSHIVNFMQGLKTPALQYLLDGDPKKHGAYTAAFDPKGWVMRQCGRPDRMINGSEPMADRSASQGTELCAIAERILSCQTVVAATGDMTAADDLEIVTYNSLAATIAPDGRGCRYYCLLNQPSCEDKYLCFANNGGKGDSKVQNGSICPGPHSGFGCCRSNFHLAWPKFVQSMWMRKDDGFAAVAYGPCALTTVIGGRETVIEEKTEYPFDGKVVLRIAEGGGRFPIYARVPTWCGSSDAGTFRKFEREWKTGDEIVLDFPMQVTTSHWGEDAVALHRGPLLFALRPYSEEHVVERYQVPFEDHQIDSGAFPRKEIRATSDWGYAIVLNKDKALPQVEVVGSGTGTCVRVKAIKSDFGGWGYMRDVTTGRAVDPPHSPIPDEGADVTTIDLVPMGLAQVRIVVFPWVRETGSSGRRDCRTPLVNCSDSRKRSLSVGICRTFPESAFMHSGKGGNLIDVTKAPFFAKGDGVHDDTKALLAALKFAKDNTRPAQEPGGRVGGSPRRDTNWTIYLPEGVYLVSDTLSYGWPAVAMDLTYGWEDVRYVRIETPGAEERLRQKPLPSSVRKLYGAEINWNIRIIGANRDKTIILLKDRAAGFGPGEYRPILSYHLLRSPSNVNYGNFLEGLTIDTGHGNQGAVGVKWSCSNYGAIRDVSLKGEGASVGIDMPVSNVCGYFQGLNVKGFQTAFRYASGNESTLTVEDVVVDSADVAFAAEGGDRGGSLLNLRHISCAAVKTNVVVALGRGARVVIRDCPFALDTRQALVAAKDAPPMQWPRSEEIATPEEFGAVGDGLHDDTAAIQQAMDSGCRAVFFTRPSYAIAGTVSIPASVTLIDGMFSGLCRYDTRRDAAMFCVAEGADSSLELRRFYVVGAKLVDHEKERLMVLNDTFVEFPQGRGASTTEGYFFPGKFTSSALQWYAYRNSDPSVRKRLFAANCVGLCAQAETGTWNYLENVDLWARAINNERDAARIDGSHEFEVGGSAAYAMKNCCAWIFGAKSELCRTSVDIVDSTLDMSGFNYLNWEPTDFPESPAIRATRSAYVIDGYFWKTAESQPIVLRDIDDRGRVKDRLKEEFPVVQGETGFAVNLCSPEISSTNAKNVFPSIARPGVVNDE